MTPRLYLKIIARFKEVFGHKGETQLYFAPGRVTLIGEHIDYSGGSTITTAVDRGTYIVVRKRNDSKINIYSHAFKIKKSFALENISVSKEDEWAVYLKGVVASIQQAGYSISGMDAFIHTELPFRASLAASSALCAGFTLATLDINQHKLSPIEMANLSYKGEIMYGSENTSISDHVSIFVSKRNMVTLFNASKMQYETLPLKIDNYSIAVVNSNKKRVSSNSEYNSRRREADNALKKLKEKDSSIEHLCDLKIRNTDLVQNTLLGKELRRAMYALSEQERVMQALKAIKKSSMKDLAALVKKTHDGLSTLYEVSTAELDILVEESLKIDGVLGSRMIGTGFGGGVLMLLNKADVENVVETLYSAYKEKTRRDADVYILKPSDGARLLPIE